MFSLRIVLKNLNAYYNCYDLDAIDAAILSDNENLFRQLPIDFRNAYKNLENIHNTDMLYKYSYSAFMDSQKLQKTIESNTVEFGQTSTNTAILRINNYLHFLLGNGIISSIFNEYKTAVKSLMSSLIFKYSTQTKKQISETLVPAYLNQHISFDEVDLYCLLECFDSKELLSVLQKYDTDIIEFKNMDLIEYAVQNILSYYEYLTKKSNNRIELSHLETKIKTCLILFRYVSISQDLVDRLCSFLFSRELYEIRIDDKIFFLEYQVIKQKKYSAITAKIIESKLIFYIDSHLKAIEQGKNFALHSTRNDINYYNLVHYINPEKDQVSRKLSTKFSNVIKTNSSNLNKIIVEHYYKYLTNSQKKIFIANLKKLLKCTFQFDIFSYLIYCNAYIEDVLLNQLKEYLHNQILKNSMSAKRDGIRSFPPRQPYGQLDEIGYLCFTNVLNKEDFGEFLGYSDKFDFFYQYDIFDFDKFDVSWLIYTNRSVLKLIAKNQNVKSKIRFLIANELKTNKVNDNDYKILKDILIQYFCD